MAAFLQSCMPMASGPVLAAGTFPPSPRPPPHTHTTHTHTHMLQVCEMASIVTQADIDLTRKMDQSKMNAFEEAVAGIAAQLSERCGAFNGELLHKSLHPSCDTSMHYCNAYAQLRLPSLQFA